MGKEKLYFPLLTSVKCQKAPLGGSVSTDFVTDCTVTSLKWLIFHFLTSKNEKTTTRFQEWFWVNQNQDHGGMPIDQTK